MHIERCRECDAPVIAGLGPGRWGILLDAEPTATSSGYALVAGGGGLTPKFAPTTSSPAYRAHWPTCGGCSMRARLGWDIVTARETGAAR